MLKPRIKHFIGQFPSIFFPIYNILAPKHNRTLLCNKNTDIVIEGFPRSANTFAVVYFEKAQKNKVNIAHHLHVEAQIIRAVEMKIPACVLIRNPEDCIRSLLMRHPETSIEWALNRYIQFYKNLLPIKRSCLFIEYKEVIQDMCTVIQKINSKFLTNFELLEHAPKTESQVFTEIENINNRIDAGQETHVARPNEKRKKEGQKINLNEYTEKLNIAFSIYKRCYENT